MSPDKPALPPPGPAHGAMQVAWVYVLLVGSLLLRLSVLDYSSGDYRAFLSVWYDHLVEHGRWAALKDDFSNYPPLYLYLLSLATFLPLPKLYSIKLLSIAADYILAWFLFRIVRCRFPEGPWPWAAAGALLFLPTVWLNSAVWGQCDAMFTAALVATLYYLMSGRPLAAMVAFGLAGSLKPQAIFLLPFLVGAFPLIRIPWRYAAVPVGVYALIGLPAMLAGRPVLEVMLHWGRQTPFFRKLTVGATNWYQWLSDAHYDSFHTTGIVLTLVVTVFLILAMQQPPSMDRRTWLVTTATFSTLFAPYFLPGMHERYFYAADVFSIAYAFFVPGGWRVALAVQGCSFFTYLPYLFEREPVPRPFLALVMTAALALVGRDLVRAIVQPKPKPESA